LALSLKLFEKRTIEDLEIKTDEKMFFS